MRSRQSEHPDLQNKAPGSWYNSECSAAKSIVCYHKGEVGAIPPPEETFDKECGPGWVRGLDFCYLLRPDPTTWHSAKSNCQNTGPLSELLYVTTKSEWMYIKSLAANAGSSFIGPLPAGQVRAKEYWIDFYAAAQDGWHWPYRDDRDRNRLPMAVFNWAQDEPRYGSQNVPHCAFMQDTEDAGWAASYCAVNKPYICKKPRTRVAIITNSTAAPPVTGGFSCLAPFSSIADQCVYLNDTAVSWEDAQDSCHQIGGDLLSIHSAMQYENIGSRIHGSWVGLNSINDPMNPRVFSWSDGSPVSFTPWDISAGSNALYGDTSIFGQANCVVTQRTGYVVYTCEEEKPFACSSTKLSPTEGPDVITIPHDEGCNRWGIGHDRSCYYFGQTATGTGTRPPLNFEEAQTFCRTSYPGSRLLQVDSAREESFISRIIAQFGSDYWIGLKEERNPWDAFKFWLDGTRVLYTKWADGEPHVGPNGALGCVALQGSYNQGRYPGDWYVASCDLVKYALCEAPRAGVLPTRPTTTPGPNRNGCPTGWVQPTTLSGAPSNRCFKAFFGSSNGVTISEGPSGASYPKVSWAIAERFCNGYKTGHLASIETSQENDMVKSILLPDLTVGAEGHNYWIGLREETSPTGALRWAWSDGTPVTNTFFHSAVSHASDVQDCAAFDSATSRWIQQNCDLSWGWVCEVQQGVYRPNDVLPAIPTVIPANRTCGVDNSGAGVWYYIPETDECVFITRRLNTWNGAAYECFQLGSWLAVITAENNAFITESTSQFSTSAGSAQYWIGLHVTNPAEQRHEWINETPLTYARWETGEPNAYTTDTCGLLNSRSGKWIDQQCGRQHPYVCVKPSVGSFIPTPPPTPDRTKGGCAVGWVGFRGDCYYISKAFTEDKTFQTALNWCRGMMPHGDLASVLDSAENDFLITQIRHRSNPNVSYVSSNMWLGLKEKSPSSNEWAWTDGSAYQYTNWYYQYPKDPSFVVECIAMMSEINSAGTWKNFVCSGLNGFVCKAPKNMDLPAIQPTSDCPLSGFKRIGGACFRIVEIPGTHGTSWDAARQACRDLNPGDSRTDIATIHDIYENAFIRIMGEEMRTAGSFDVQAWIGMQERDGGYHWYNNCPATFTDIGSLINHPVEDQCLYQSGGHWVSTDCDTLGINYAVCEQRLTPCPVIANLTGGECPANFTRECSNHCFHIEGAYIHDNRTTRIGFAEARQLCRDLGGDLASVRNAEDQKCIFSYIQSAVWGHWIGLVYTFEGGLGRWQWLDEAMGLGPAVYTNWGTGEPNGASGSESCVEMYPNGYWNNVLCRNTVTRGYICQAPKRNIEVAKTTVVWTAPPTIARTTKAPATSPGPTIVVPVTSSPAFTGPQEGSTTHPVGQPGGKEAPGMSGGDVAGLVIGLLIAMTIIGAAAFMYLTGKTPRDVLRRFQTVGSSVRESTIHFTPKKYRKRADDREEIVVSPATGGGNPNYSGTDSETYT
ncbi:C-type mannose receptor 2 [Hypsibius exemplaris]|uniref:C-type mannose receptor 2 n=1 Tax=Hypsibius exemplaris TaxID=2072580 RepID=A0A1W0X5T2_HYPEX|nr:C-type mannose receptor 2 [Hypsibius exemplaris]